MRKFLFATILTLCVLACAVASAQSFTFADISAKCDVPDSYILLTPDNLDQHEEWVASQGTTKEAILEQWASSGVLLEAWTTDGDACLIISAVKDADAQQYYDIDQQSTTVRSAYRKKHLSGAEFKAQGYTYQSAEWKKTSQYGRFLVLKYKRTVGEDTYRGYARRTIRNGYTITLDYQVYGRALKNTDNTALNKIMATWSFSTVSDVPAEAAAKTAVSAAPPAETSTGTFSVEGTAEPGAHLVGVVMRMSSPEPIRVETDANAKTGKFSMDVTLPEEGVWLMTVTVENQNVVVDEIIFDPTTYQKTLLPVNFDSEITATVTGDTLTISGKTIRNVSVQCMVNDSYDKLIKTNASGKFSFKLDTAAEGAYSITLVFQKKNYDTRRFTFTTSRVITEESLRAQYRDEAVKPAYSTLTSKLKGYTGRIMVYTLYVVKFEQYGDQWVITMAMDRSKSGVYKNIVVVTTTQEPNFSLDSQQRMYGRCTGSYQIQDDAGLNTYPSFELLFWD